MGAGQQGDDRRPAFTSEARKEDGKIVRALRSMATAVMDLYRAGRYDRAVVVSKKALEVAERSVGPDHPDVDTDLNNLATLCYRQGQYAQAEPLCKRALAIYEKGLGPDHPYVATSLNNLAHSMSTRISTRRRSRSASAHWRS